MQLDSAAERSRLRSSEPDLKVIVGTDEIEVFWHYKAILAHESDYVDTFLSTQVGAHRERTVNFPDVTPSQWKLMMKFLRQPHLMRTIEVNTDTV